LALLISVGLVLFVFESYVPYPVPWVRMGLGNVATLLALFVLGPREAILVTLARTTLGPLVLGTLLTPVFVFSFGAGLCSVVTMVIAHQRWPRGFGVVGVSIWGAVAHNTAQLALAYFLFIRSPAMVSLLPLVPILSVATGTITGLLAYWSLEKLVPEWRLKRV
jgi:heptaprenyl diphosphate synthase